MSPAGVSPTLPLVVLGETKKSLRSAVTGYSVAADELVMVANPAARWGGYGTIGNRYLRSMLSDVIGIIHADTALSQETCDNLVAAASGGAVAGVVGCVDKIGNVWSRDVVAPTRVSTLDSCAVFVSHRTAMGFGLRFDVETFDAFHCCVEDFCLQASTQGVPVVVVPGWALHPFPLDTDTQHWPPTEHKLYKDRLMKKWAGVSLGTT